MKIAPLGPAHLFRHRSVSSLLPPRAPVLLHLILGERRRGQEQVFACQRAATGRVRRRQRQCSGRQFMRDRARERRA